MASQHRLALRRTLFDRWSRAASLQPGKKNPEGTRQRPSVDTATTREFQIELYVDIEFITPSDLLIRVLCTFIGLARTSHLSQSPNLMAVKTPSKQRPRNIHLRRAESDCELVQNCHPRQLVTAALELAGFRSRFSLTRIRSSL